MEIISSILQPLNLVLCFLGCFLGLLIGALPGMGTTMAIALVLPFAYKLSPLTAILLLLCVYQGAEYGGSISAITLNIPGTAGASATVLDGHPMSKRGQAGQALRYSLVASTIGGLFGALVLAFLTEPIGRFSLIFSAPDLFMLGMIACFAVIMLATDNFLKGMIGIVFGLMLSTVGTDIFTGTPRYTYGLTGLYDGIYTISMICAVFAIPEMLDLVSSSLRTRYVSDAGNMKSHMGLKDYKRIAKPVACGSILGTVIGVFPALGGGVAAWMSYTFTKKTSKHPEEFGKGSPEGIAAPEAANNASVGGALIPLLALGIPGSTASAVIGAAFMMFGLQVGPALFSSSQELLNGIYYGFFISVIALYVLGRLLTPGFAKVVTVKNSILVPIILLFTILGIYAGDKDFLNLWVALGLGVLFFLFKKLDYPLAPMCIAFILGPVIEKNYKRSLDLSAGDISIFWQSTCSKVILAILVLIVLFPIVRAVLRSAKERQTDKAQP